MRVLSRRGLNVRCPHGSAVWKVVESLEGRGWLGELVGHWVEGGGGGTLRSCD